MFRSENPKEKDPRVTFSKFSKLAESKKSREKRIIFYLSALDEYDKIEGKNDNDEISAATVCTNIAVVHFNQNRYEKAAEYYRFAINHLIKITQYRNFQDTDYRRLIKNHMDLADAYRQIKTCSPDAARKEFKQAIKYLLLIEDRTDEEEKAIQTANDGDEYQSFHDMTLAKTSVKNYINSDKYQSSRNKFFDDINERKLIKGLKGITFSLPSDQEGVNALASGIEAMTLSSAPQQPHATQQIFLWGKKPQPNNTNDNIQPDSEDIGMRLC